jgi:hypothetical protein
MEYQALQYYYTPTEIPPLHKETTLCFLTCLNCYQFLCPHCNTAIQVLKDAINCTIFRCGVWKQNGQPIAPHTSRQECERLVNENLIFGCGNPFKFDGITVEKCDFI